ncbi:aminoacyl-tRNA hydrolase [Richelia intracellularis]|jgi:PTH1 family peptidyl-tRNA hydrolase|nr:aminoacyl-tRNA hydrolase [Richelia intracellularis]
MTETVKKTALVMPQLIVGLGNPETKYNQTRHNIGFAALDALSSSWQAHLLKNRKFQGEYGEGFTPVERRKVHLLKPSTYMNLSGQAIQALTSWYNLPPESVLVIYDDMDLPLGKTRWRLSGSAGGHNGMKSIITHLNTQNFPRLRIGIGKPKKMLGKDENHSISYVLGKFSTDERKVMSEIIKFVVECVELCFKQGVEKAINQCNSNDFSLATSRKS